MVQRWQMALVLACLPATYLVVRVIQGDPLTRTRGLVAWGVAFLVALVALVALLPWPSPADSGGSENCRCLPKAPDAVTESVKPGETRGVYALCVASWRGSLIQAMVGSLGGWGRRVNRVGLAA